MTATDGVQAAVLVEGEQISLTGAFVRWARFGEQLQPGAARVA